MKQKLYFKNSKGDKLCGILSNPSEDNTKPILVLCHGFSSNKDSKTYLSFENIFNESNISTFRFDFYGHGKSEGKFEDVTTSEAVDDILKAIDFLKNKGYLKIGLVGSSFGGLASIMAASKSDDLFILALKAPVSDFREVRVIKYGKEGVKRWKEDGYTYYTSGDGRKLRINYSFFEDFKNNDGYKAAEKIDIISLIVHGDEDKTVPIKQSIRTSDLMKKCRLEIIKGADHNFSNPQHFEKMINLISGFIIDNA